MNPTETAWLAGLLEGEGCFAHKPHTPSIQLSMADEDVVRRAAAIMGGTVHKYPKGRWQPQWHIAVHGNTAIDIMRTIRPLMGERRGKKIDDVLQQAAARSGYCHGEGHYCAKLSGQTVIFIRALSRLGLSYRKLSNLCGISVTAIRDAVTGETWRRIRYGLKEA